MIKFGKDGWTAVISDEFTFDNVREVATAIAVYLIDRHLPAKPIIVGYDSRFLSEKFAEAAVKTLAQTGRSFLLADRDLPLPVIVFEVTDRDAAGALVIGAGGMPPQYSGVKFIPGHGRTAEDTKTIATFVYLSGVKSVSHEVQPEMLKYQSALHLLGKGLAAKTRLERFDPRERYLKYAEASVDGEAIRRSGLKIVVDPMFGSVRGYFDVLLQRLGCLVEEIHNYRDVLFGGLVPDPKEENLVGLRVAMAEQKADLGFAFNGDGSAYAVIDGPGQYKYHGEAGDSLLNCLRLVEMSAKKKI